MIRKLMCWLGEAKYFEPFEILADDWEIVDECK